MHFSVKQHFLVFSKLDLLLQLFKDLFLFLDGVAVAHLSSELLTRHAFSFLLDITCTVLLTISAYVFLSVL